MVILFFFHASEISILGVIEKTHMCRAKTYMNMTTQYIFTTRGLTLYQIFIYLFFIYAALLFFNLFSKTRQKIAIAGEC